MHCEFPGMLGAAIQAVSRFSVPFFFMISGYYSYYATKGTFKAGRKIAHIGKITLWASVFYFLVALMMHFVPGARLTVSGRMLTNWLVFNQPVIISGHLWFLFALLYTYILFAVADRLKLTRFANWLVSVLILAYVGLAQGLHLAGVKVPNMVYRNFLIEGFPLFMLGHWLHSHEAKIIEFCSDKALWLTLVATTAGCLLERMLMGRDFGVNICTFPQVAALFILGMKHPGCFAGQLLAKMGEKLSLHIYILHNFVWRMLNITYGKLHISKNVMALYLKPLIVLVVTVLISLALAVCLERWLLRVNKTQQMTGNA
jgi:surface polysaccharide O-acyltransferase-like enzyme